MFAAHQPLRGQDRDPLLWTCALALVFFALVLNRLTIPARPMFDEIHYLPAARRLIELTSRLNPEHPLLGKEFIALGMKLFGDGPLGWRMPNAVLGTIGVFAATRALWWASGSRAASLMFGALLASNFIWFVMSRIAMLDMAMAAMLALAFWQWALAWRRQKRLHLALCGVFLGLSLAGKWNGIPLLVMPGLLFAWDRAWALGPRWRAVLTARDVGPVRGVSLLEAALWLGAVPLAVYFATFAPTFFYKVQPMTLRGLIPWQQYMLQLQDSVVKPHRYMSRWWQWTLNLRPIWFLYEKTAGGLRGILLVGNPFTMLAGLPALLLCLWEGARRPDRLRIGVVIMYVAALIFWALNGKPVQFFYHYELAATFLMAALAITLAGWWEAGTRWPAVVSLALAVAMFIGFYPILSAGKLANARSYEWYVWMNGWH
ncbi:phospholipid carrier-dependent glycosyltransferase [Novosphingobium sp. Chol11]|uniref:phospholipid carrier-dependent glycosyltransferase n=1 Tax=Novosphingobium sp. Chol11 TaxID=1385763 RepID=UPI0025E78C9B|nr:phospholipid carrier-dependent glycosyltransferase [Novosphingobium sp. Chol11]